MAGWENLRVDDDGLVTPQVGGWAETKYRLLALYTELFSTGMKNKWDQRVYIDLYAGAGYSRIQETSRFLKGSPVIALTVTHLFDKYIFCEEDKDLLDALEARAGRIARQANKPAIPSSSTIRATSSTSGLIRRRLRLCCGRAGRRSPARRRTSPSRRG